MSIVNAYLAWTDRSHVDDAPMKRRRNKKLLDNIRRIMTSDHLLPGWCAHQDRRHILAYYWVKDGAVDAEDVKEWRT